MTKPTIAKLFFGSLIVLVGGIVLLAAGAVWAFASGLIVIDDSGISTRGALVGDPSVIILGLAVGVIAVLGGAIGQLVAWLGAVVNTSHLEDKTWFVLLLVLGLVSFGFVAMVVYVLVGPDGLETEHTRIAHGAGGAA